MARPRFLTALAVSAVVCEGLEERSAGGAVVQPDIAFEWYLVEAFARLADRDLVRQTPGIDKARTAVDAKLPLSSKGYLKTPNVFGFHAVYKRLARHIGILNPDEMGLAEAGYELLDVWQREQGLGGFVGLAAGSGLSDFCGRLRDAVAETLTAGHTARTASWQGWRFFVEHLTPEQIGRREAACLWRLLHDVRGDRRGEVFDLAAIRDNRSVIAESHNERDAVRCLLPQSSADLAERWRAICAYEAFCVGLDDAFDWLRLLSTRAGAKTLSRSEFASAKGVQKLVSQLLPNLHAATSRLEVVPGDTAQLFGRIAEAFESVATAEALYDALIQRHSVVQQSKQKREWFERAADDTVMVRSPYRHTEQPPEDEFWRRPYRLRAVLSFCDDLRRGRS